MPLPFEHKGLLARRAPLLRPSVWHDLAPLIKRPGVISLASGAPAAECFPTERLRWASAQAWDDADEALRYGETEGYAPLRETIAGLMTARGTSTDPEEIIVTNGSQQGLDLVARALIDPGDTIIVEAPTYTAALQAFDAYEPRYVAVPLDAEGPDPRATEAALQAGGVKLIYLIPNFQNPSGVTTSAARRAGLVALARRYGVAILEDDPYGDLRYTGQPAPSVRSCAPELTVYLGTFSKTLAPGLRVGWLAAPPWLLPLLWAGKEAVDISTDRIVQRTVYHACRDNFLDRHLPAIRAVYAERRARMIAALAAHCPAGVRWTEPEGGFFIWVTLPAGWDAEALLQRASREGVGFVPGRAFYPAGSGGKDALRLGFAPVSPDQIEEAIARLGRAMRDR